MNIFFSILLLSSFALKEETTFEQDSFNPNWLEELVCQEISKYRTKKRKSDIQRIEPLNNIAKEISNEYSNKSFTGPKRFKVNVRREIRKICYSSGVYAGSIHVAFFQTSIFICKSKFSYYKKGPEGNFNVVKKIKKNNSKSNQNNEIEKDSIVFLTPLSYEALAKKIYKDLIKSMVEKAKAPEHKIHSSMLELDDIVNPFYNKQIYVNKSMESIKANLAKRNNCIYMYSRNQRNINDIFEQFITTFNTFPLIKKCNKNQYNGVSLQNM